MVIRIWSVEWCSYQRLSVTYNLDFKVTVLVVYAMHGIVFMQLTRDLFAIAKFLFISGSLAHINTNTDKIKYTHTHKQTRKLCVLITSTKNKSTIITLQSTTTTCTTNKSTIIEPYTNFRSQQLSHKTFTYCTKPLGQFCNERVNTQALLCMTLSKVGKPVSRKTWVRL